MANADSFKSILDRQKEIIADLDSEIKELENSDLLSENRLLKEELSAEKTGLEIANRNNRLLETENKYLKNALYEQVYNERMAILKTSSQKLEVYFKANYEAEINKLTKFVVAAKKRINEMTATLHENHIDLEDEIYTKIGELDAVLDKKITLMREELSQTNWEFQQNTEEQLNKLKQEQLTEEQLKGVVKKNNFEALIGLNVINKIGILLLVIGVIAASQYTFFQMSDIYKGIFGLMAGALLVVVGELMNRRSATIFSLGLTSGGIAVLFATLALSYFELNILEMYPALLLCILTTLGAFVLSVRYNAQTIAAFALIGGYLPLFSIYGNKVLVYSAMGYFIILNLFALVLSTKKKWTVTSFLGFFLNVVGTIYIMVLLLNAREYDLPFNFKDLPTLGYIAFAFIIYTLIPISSTYFKRLKFKSSDIVLLGLNTAISALLMYVAFYEVNLHDFTGLLAILFAVIYLSLGRFLENNLSKEKNAQALFYLTGFTFVVLIIPFQFGRVWLSLGWLVEGAGLLIYGIVREQVNFRKIGAVIFGLCLAAFLLFDVFDFFTPFYSYGRFFVYKYFAVTLGSVLVLAAAYRKRSLSTRAITWFKYGTTINLWLFLMYIIGEKFSYFLSSSLKNSYWAADYLVFALMVVVSYLLAYLIPRIKLLRDGVMKGISIVIYVISLFSLLILNAYTPIEGFMRINTPLLLKLSGTLVIVFISILAVLALRDLMLRLVMERKIGLEWYPLIISSFFVFILTETLIMQYNLAFTNAAISIIYVVTALSWIIFGFVKRYSFIRRFGLGLAIMALAKLFFLDLSFLTEIAKIISYFAFGITLLAISYVYQRFNKKLEIKGGLLPDERKIKL